METILTLLACLLFGMVSEKPVRSLYRKFEATTPENQINH